MGCMKIVCWSQKSFAVDSFFFLHTLSDYMLGLVVLHFDFDFLNKNYVN